MDQAPGSQVPPPPPPLGISYRNSPFAILTRSVSWGEIFIKQSLHCRGPGSRRFWKPEVAWNLPSWMGCSHAFTHKSSAPNFSDSFNTFAHREKEQCSSCKLSRQPAGYVLGLQSTSQSSADTVQVFPGGFPECGSSGAADGGERKLCHLHAKSGLASSLRPAQCFPGLFTPPPPPPTPPLPFPPAHLVRPPAFKLGRNRPACLRCRDRNCSPWVRSSRIEDLARN